jgi:hypothetical protein
VVQVELAALAEEVGVVLVEALGVVEVMAAKVTTGSVMVAEMGHLTVRTTRAAKS